MLLPFKDDGEKKIPVKLLCIEELIVYLTKQNDNILVYVTKIYRDTENGTKIYEMSNGLCYTKDAMDNG